VPGSELPKVRRYYDEPFEYSGLDVAVVGGRNSAAETALELYRNGARVTLIHRGPVMSEGVKYWILPDIQNRISNGEIAGHFQSTVKEIRSSSLLVEGPSGTQEIPNDVMFVMTGYSPLCSLLRDAGVVVDENTRIPQHDPGTMETNVPGLYVAGSIAAGDFNNRIFIENGRLHGDLIMRSIAEKR
jgi:thioredoxin reductase (NADPH)